MSAERGKAAGRESVNRAVEVRQCEVAKWTGRFTICVIAQRHARNLRNPYPKVNVSQLDGSVVRDEAIFYFLIPLAPAAKTSSLKASAGGWRS
jgi:hypothetical protein